MSFSTILSWMKGHYEKIVAFGALVALLGSLLYLGVHAGLIDTIERDFDVALARTHVRHPKAGGADLTPAADAARALDSPFQVPVWTNRFLVPELRVWCVDCRRPIPYDAMVCTFEGCLAAQPDWDTNLIVRLDSDDDTMPNVYETRHGLDPYDASDAQKDKDGDLFLNIIEFNEKTSPSDPNDYPPLEKLLVLARLIPHPFRLKFRSVITLPDGAKKFFINFTVRGRISTESARLGEVVEGYALHKYEVREEMRDRPGYREKVKTDVHVLFLKKGDEIVELEKGLDIRRDEYSAELLFTLDKSRYVVKEKDPFSLKDRKYAVIDIDSVNKVVVIERLKDGKRFDISPSLRKGSEENADDVGRMNTEGKDSS